MKFDKHSFILIISFTVFQPVFPAGFMPAGQDENVSDTTSFVSPFYEDNEKCFKCHGQKTYEYLNENLGRNVKALMFSERIVDREEFYQANHRSFSCTDCHSADYEIFPHPGELRMEQNFNCIDCHGGDDMFTEFNFDTIDIEYQLSVHFKLEEEGFSCWKCHGPHDYRINIRNSTNLLETIRYDNAICLNCHSDFDRFQLLSEREEISMLETHDWLPNQAAHFGSVRCIECHTEISDNILVAHLVTPKEEAVKKCNECHSRNSMLMSSLYKFQAKEKRKAGFINGVILNESYVIGANRNMSLNILSFVLFGLVACAITIHIIFRIIRKH
ncbi:MAG: cytochrome c3 family protein [Bacteroidales bacterium]|nr:cytochrome c3 family protein [Bacteroidales bacterium]